MYMKKFFTIASALFLATSLSAKVVYVATDGNNSNDGSTWDNAVADIQKAYTLANAGDEIWIYADNNIQYWLDSWRDICYDRWFCSFSRHERPSKCIR